MLIKGGAAALAEGSVVGAGVLIGAGAGADGLALLGLLLESGGGTKLDREYTHKRISIIGKGKSALRISRCNQGKYDQSMCTIFHISISVQFLLL